MRFAGLALVLASLAYGLSSYPLLDPDEGRNAEVAREMAVSNHYLLPTLNSLPYVDKPVLYFAAAALAIEALGPTELAVRLPSLLFTLGTLVVVWVFCRRLFDEDTAWVATIATGAAPLTLAFARTVIFDAALTFFLVTALTAFYLAVEETARRLDGQTANDSAANPAVQPSSRLAVYSAIAWASIAFGVLTKGPIALALPLMIAIPYVVWRRAWRALVDPVGILLFLALVLPWVRYMSEHVPGYLHYVLATETFGRLTTPALQRTGPWWYFLPILVVGALPWSVMAVSAMRRPAVQPSSRPAVFLLMWILVPLIFFSLSQSKRPQYVLPLIPAIAILAAARWNERNVIAGAVALGLFGASVLTAYRLFPFPVRNMSPETAAAIPGTALALGLICLGTAGAAVAFRRHRYAALLALSVPVVSVPFVSTRLMREIGRDRSSVALARAIQPLLTDATQVVGVSTYPLSLPFYLRRPLVLSTATGQELTSNYLVADLELWRGISATPLRTEDWWREAAVDCARPTVFVIRADDSEARTFLSARLPHLAETRKHAAYGPCGTADLAVLSPARY